MQFLKGKGRYAVAAVALVVAFALSVQLGERGVQFDLSSTPASAESADDDDYRLSSLRIFNRALLQIKENYVEPDRIEPGQMLLAALNAVQEEIPEFVVNYERNDSDEVPDRVEIQVVDQTEGFELQAMESLWEMSLRLKEIFMFVEQHLPEDDEREIEEIEYAAINGMVTILDPHSGLLTPTHYEEMQTQTGGEFGGLGIVISIQDDELTVISPIDGTPAAEEGIRSQDRITRIGEESTVNMNLNEAVNRLRGEPGTEIDIWIQRDGWSDPRQFTLERDVIEIESVESEPLEDKIGYLRINNFQANTYPDVRTHLDELRETMGGIEGLILDVRGNPGGLLDQSIDISDIFLEEGRIVSTVGVGDTLRETNEATAANTEPDYPIVVLVNEGSASASEIVAGALQQNDRALVLGDTSFGKGTVQIMYEFPDASALKLTVAQYLTPDGSSLENTGIIPDLRAMPVSVQPNSVSLFRSELMQRERDMDQVVDTPSTLPDEEGPLRYIRYLDDEAFEQQQEPDEPGTFDKDFEISLSSRLLRTVSEENRREQMLEVFQDELQSVFDTEMGQIKDQLMEQGVDWASGSSPQEPTYDLEIRSSAEDGVVQAGDTVELTAALTNRSSEPLYRAKALTSSDNPQLSYEEFVFGQVEPDETQEWTIEVEIPQDSSDRHDRIEFNVSDDDQEFEGNHHYDLVIESKDRPHYAFTYEVVNEERTDGILRVGDEIQLQVHLENRGDVTGDDTSVYLKNLTGEEVYLEEGRGVVTGLEPGETETVDFQFDLNRIPDDGYVTFEIDVYDAGFRDFVQREFRLPVTDEDPDIRDVDGIAQLESESATLHVAAHSDSDPVAVAGDGASLPVVAQSGDWWKVQLDERIGWVSGDEVSVNEGAAGQLSGIERMMRFQKPLVRLSPAQMLTSDSNLTLEAFIEDEWDIEDYYVIVQQRTGPMDVQTRKFEYSRVGANEADLSAQLELFEGHNEISVITRNDAGIETTETVFVYREAS